jgi:hypothetical protein
VDNLVARTGGQDDAELLHLKSCRNQLAPFDVLAEPLTGSQPYPYQEAICASW